MRGFALASGSSGNCYYVESSNGMKVLVDLGLSFSRTKELLDERTISIDSIDAIFITHEHSDHVFGIKSFLNKLKCPIYITKGTAKTLKLNGEDNLKFVKNHDSFSLGDMNILVLEKAHDVIEGVHFVFDDGRKLGIFTDFGHVTDEIKHSLKNLDIVFFETNYCEDYVRAHKHEYNMNYLNRLMSDVGHLGLHQACEALCEASHNGQKIILSHISENTNTYENAYLKIKHSLEEVGKFPQIYVSFHGEPTPWIE